MGITRTYLSLGECALYRHTLRDRLYHRRSSRDHVRFGGLFQLLVRRGSDYPFRNSVRFLLLFRIPSLLGIRRESLCQMELLHPFKEIPMERGIGGDQGRYLDD